MPLGEAVRPLVVVAKELLDATLAAAPFLQAWPTSLVSRSVAASRLPVLDWLAAMPALAVPRTSALVQAIVDHADTTAWRQTYAASDFGAAFLDRYGWSEWIGLRGPLANTEIACGVLMLGPEVDYPAHAHEAEELYLPLAGTALWQRDDDAFTSRPPGTAIHHPAWMPHAMRTEADPLLALYLWRGGDLAAKSRIIGRE